MDGGDLEGSAADLEEVRPNRCGESQAELDVAGFDDVAFNEVGMWLHALDLLVFSRCAFFQSLGATMATLLQGFCV